MAATKYDLEDFSASDNNCLEAVCFLFGLPDAW